MWVGTPFWVLQNEWKASRVTFLLFLNEFNQMFGSEVMVSQRDEGDRKST